MRGFVAITLPDAVAGRLAEIGAACPMGRAVPEENLHLTLTFLGDVSGAALEELDEALSAMRGEAFSLSFSGLGTFGGPRPRALWAGVAAEPRLTELAKRVERKARGAGIEIAHRRFVPHVTLARFGSGAEETAEFRRYVAVHAGLALGPVDVRSFGLFASHLGKGGAVYEELGRYPLVEA